MVTYIKKKHEYRTCTLKAKLVEKKKNNVCIYTSHVGDRDVMQDNISRFLEMLILCKNLKRI